MATSVRRKAKLPASLALIVDPSDSSMFVILLYFARSSGNTRSSNDSSFLVLGVFWIVYTADQPALPTNQQAGRVTERGRISVFCADFQQEQNIKRKKKEEVREKKGGGEFKSKKKEGGKKKRRKEMGGEEDYETRASSIEKTLRKLQFYKCLTKDKGKCCVYVFVLFC